MREDAIDEFESLFEQASIPVLDIKEVVLNRLSAILVGHPLDATILSLATYLKSRFGATVTVHRLADQVDESTSAQARNMGFELVEDSFSSAVELLGQIATSRCHLVIMPAPQNEAARALDLDDLVEGVLPPVLVVRQPIDSPAAVFKTILHSLTANFQQTQNFSYSFTLVEDGGAVRLLHTIAAAEIDDVRDALQVSPDIAADDGDELLKNLAHHGERFLKAVVLASRDKPCDVSYRLAVGDVVAEVRAEIAGGGFGLLVVGKHRSGRSHVAAEDYRLMHQVTDIPVLAL